MKPINCCLNRNSLAIVQRAAINMGMQISLFYAQEWYGEAIKEVNF
jgi:hypothetical protein